MLVEVQKNWTSWQCVPFISKLVVLDVSNTADVRQESSNSILHFQVEFLLFFWHSHLRVKKIAGSHNHFLSVQGFI